MQIIHPFKPVWTPQSKVMILGTMPSVASRENQFYYGHPNNRFWRVLAGLYDVEVPQTIDEKKNLLSKYDIALWDVLSSCEITGSDDASIRHPISNDIAGLVAKCAVEKILLNGKKAYSLYEKYCAADIKIPAICMPSTSPANAAWGLERLISTWSAEL